MYNYLLLEYKIKKYFNPVQVTFKIHFNAAKSYRENELLLEVREAKPRKTPEVSLYPTTNIARNLQYCGFRQRNSRHICLGFVYMSLLYSLSLNRDNFRDPLGTPSPVLRGYATALDLLLGLCRRLCKGNSIPDPLFCCTNLASVTQPMQHNA